MARMLNVLCSLIFVGIAVMAIYTAYFGLFDPIYHRGLSVAAAFVAVVAIRHTSAARLSRLRMAIDVLLLAVFLWGIWLFADKTAASVALFVDYSLRDQIVALLAALALVEVTRREFGTPLAAVAGLGLAYCFVGPWLPGMFYHAGFSLDQTMQFVWFGFQGVFGLPVGVVLETILIFIVFGVVLGGTGAADTLIKMAFAATGRLQGGPAHAAIIASGMFGAMSGSVTANVVGTGTFTIPMIRRRGFTPAFAGALETAASTGGQIMPPVMGAAAFLMADLTGTPYATICIAALTPALLYYLSLFLSVTFETRRLGIEPIPVAERERITRQDLVRSVAFVGPICVIIFVLMAGRSPASAGFWATVAAVALGFVNPEFRRNPLRLLAVLRDAGTASAGIIIAVASIGIILAVLNLTGIGLTFASLVGSFAGDNLLVALILTALASLILGMGMPTVPAYLVIVLVLGPTLKQLGAETIALHMFVLYFGVLSALTPPVALAAFAAAPIARASPLTIAFKAMGLALVGFIVPFAFVYEPALLLLNDASVVDYLWAVARVTVAAWLIASGVSGHELARLGWIDRVAGFAVAGAALSNDPIVAVTAMAAGVALIARRRIFSAVRSNSGRAKSAGSSPS